ncbi:hypothetical protein HFC70_04975 [Agrobacterium sp. a22-2]|uniref:hypothetical protein n=1 Tax=Agrobacterium sp. a22-2 TaxID=2283840 RepID=UPI0014476721|nr:hypothetical protein [Agrobacterium sp. a22-2]NKN35705.1 hypothetical protein [Agrobacterium sp. a22-2]
MTATTEAFFKPEKVSKIAKAQQTDDSARAIIEAEAKARENKTQKLRELRMKQEGVATVEDEAPKKKPVRKAPAKTASSKK